MPVGPTRVAAPVDVFNRYRAFLETPLFTQYNVAESAEVDKTPPRRHASVWRSDSFAGFVLDFSADPRYVARFCLRRCTWPRGPRIFIVERKARRLVALERGLPFLHRSGWTVLR